MYLKWAEYSNDANISKELLFTDTNFTWTSSLFICMLYVKFYLKFVEHSTEVITK
jgi:hypothetical protein